MKRFNNNFFKNRTRRKNEARINDETAKRVLNEKFANQLKARNMHWEKVTARWQGILSKLLVLGGYSEGNKLTIYSDGDAAFRAMWDSIGEAKNRVWMETYIIEPDTVGTKTFQALVKAAQSGCDVRLVYDYWGSGRLSEDFLQEIQKSGVKLYPYNPLNSWPWNFKLAGLRRNHRKMIIVDDKVGYTGGMNIGDEYAGTGVGGTGYFRDTHAKIEGPAVFELMKVFKESLIESGYIHDVDDIDNKDTIIIDDYFNNDIKYISIKRKSISNKDTRYIQSDTNNNKNESVSGSLSVSGSGSGYDSLLGSGSISSSSSSSDGVFLQILQSNNRFDKRNIQRAMKLTLRESNYHCYFTTPYFLPPLPLMRSMISASRRGVDIRILTSGLSDVPTVRLASQHVYSILLKNGIRIYELFGNRLHAKTVTMDGLYSSIGSFNLDPWSDSWNLEINVTTFDTQIASQIEDSFKRDLQHSTEVTLDDLGKRSLFLRFLHWFAYHGIRLLSLDVTKFWKIFRWPYL